MDFEKYNLKSNLESAIKGNTCEFLKDSLLNYEDNILKEIYYNLTTKNINYNKTKLVDKIYKILTEKEKIKSIFNSLINDEYELVLNIIKNNGKLHYDNALYVNYAGLKYLGIIYPYNENNKFYLVIPNEIIEIIKDNLNYEKIKENTKIYNLAYSMVNFYGPINIFDFLDKCIDYYNYETYKDINLDSLFGIERLNNIRLIDVDDNKYMVKEEYLEEFSIHIIRRIILKLSESDIEIKDIPLEELLKYSDNFYFKENKETKEFFKYLKKQGLKNEQITDIIATIIQTLRLDYSDSIDYIRSIFDDYEFELNDKNYDIILNYINNIWNNLEVWGYKGWTNKEIILMKYEV